MFSLLESLQYLNLSLLSGVPAGMASVLGFDVTPSLGLPVSPQAPWLVHGHTGVAMWQAWLCGCSLPSLTFQPSSQELDHLLGDCSAQIWGLFHLVFK